MDRLGRSVERTCAFTFHARKHAIFISDFCLLFVGYLYCTVYFRVIKMTCTDQQQSGTTELSLTRGKGKARMIKRGEHLRG